MMIFHYESLLKIEPRSENATLKELYLKKLTSYHQPKPQDTVIFGIRGLEKSEPGRFLININAYMRFVRAQGILLGLFVAVGVLVKEMQSLFHSSGRSSSSALTDSSNWDGIDTESLPIRGDDEFVTAMRLAAALDCPVRMSDAPQAATLNSIRRVLDVDTVNPNKFVAGARSLAFSALGVEPPTSPSVLQSPPVLPPASSPPSQSRIKWLENIYGPSKLRPAEWINIPLVYAENWNMIKSLLPLLIIGLVSTGLTLAAAVLDENGIGLLPLLSTTTTTASTSPILSPALDLAAQLPPEVANTGQLVLQKVGGTLSFLFGVDGGELSPEQNVAVETVIEMISLLLLIRLAKLIGSDRDKIIARRVMEICNEFPVCLSISTSSSSRSFYLHMLQGSEVVVVIGMLHCNGVARHLLSGVDPLSICESDPIDGVQR
jgi:hypothetical protein